MVSNETDNVSGLLATAVKVMDQASGWLATLQGHLPQMPENIFPWVQFREIKDGIPVRIDIRQLWIRVPDVLVLAIETYVAETVKLWCWLSVAVPYIIAALLHGECIIRGFPLICACPIVECARQMNGCCCQ